MPAKDSQAQEPWPLPDVPSVADAEARVAFLLSGIGPVGRAQVAKVARTVLAALFIGAVEGAA